MRFVDSLSLLLTSVLVTSSTFAMGASSCNETQLHSERVTFFNHYGIELVGIVHRPINFDPSIAYTGIVAVGPASAVKEQASGNYATQLAAHGFVSIAFDNSFQGESGGMPRYQENPYSRIEDIRSAVDFLTTLPYVDNERIGVLGVCAGGGYAASAAMTERRIRAVGLVAPVDGGRGQRAGGQEATMGALESIAGLRTAEARGEAPSMVEWFPDTLANSTDIDEREGWEYYRTSRGASSNWHPLVRFSTMDNAVGFDAFNLAETLLTQPLQVTVGSVRGSYESYTHGHIVYDTAASRQKDIFVMEGSSHFDLYDKPESVRPTVARLAKFYGDSLGMPDITKQD